MNENVNKKILKGAGICLLVGLIGLLLVGLAELSVSLMKAQPDFLRAGERWSAKGDRYAVMTAYTETEHGFSDETVDGWVNAIDNALLNASITPSENGRSLAWCAGTQTTLAVEGPKGRATAETMAVKGDFFVFHPMSFAYGTGFLNDPSSPMGVVMDRELAWKVFGAENIVGMTVTIGGEEFTVVGVARRPEKGVEGYTVGDSPRLYMSLPGYRKIGSASLTFFEAALPNPVRAFASGIFSGAVSLNEDTSVIREATDRFSVKNRFENMKLLPYAWIAQNRILYPYWEDAARIYDYRCALLMIPEGIAAGLCVGGLLLSFVLLRASGYTVTDSVKNQVRRIRASRKKRR